MASTPSLPAVVPAQVVRLVYRHLMRLGQLYDRTPALKALLANPSYADPSIQRRYTTLYNAVQHFYGRGVVYYMEHKSLARHIRYHFKAENVAPSAVAAAVDSAFAALRMLRAHAAKHDVNLLTVDELTLNTDPAMPTGYARVADWYVKPYVPQPPPQKHAATAAAAAAGNTSTNALSADTNNKSRRTTRRSLPKLVETPLSVHAQMLRVPIEAGMMLVAHPAMSGEIFQQTVILITEHSESTGTVGVILNRPLPSLIRVQTKHALDDSVADVLQRFNAESGQFNTLMSGGPMDALTTLHRLPYFAHNSVPCIPPRMNARGGSFSTGRRAVKGSSKFASRWPTWRGQQKFWESVHQVLLQVEVQREAMKSPLVTSSWHSSSPPPPSSSSHSDIALYVGCSEWRPTQLRQELADGSWLIVKGSGVHVFNQTPLRRPRSPTKESAADDRRAPFLPAEVTATNRPEPVFPSDLLWAHCLYSFGGEYRHMAHAMYTASKHERIAAQKARNMHTRLGKDSSSSQMP